MYSGGSKGNVREKRLKTYASKLYQNASASSEKWIYKANGFSVNVVINKNY